MKPEMTKKLSPSEFFKARPEIGLVCGVPCSFFKGFINEATYLNANNVLRYVATADEGAAIAMAVGYNIVQEANGSNKRALVLLQNSGLGNTVNAITSLAYITRTPITMMVSKRGGEDDEPQHELMGEITEKLGELMQCDVDHIHENIDLFTYSNSGKHSKMIVIPKGTFVVEREPSSLIVRRKHIRSSVYEEYDFGTNITRYDAIGTIIKDINFNYEGKNVVICTTGMTGREAWHQFPNSAYIIPMVGSMGYASMYGLGMAIADPDLKVTVIDGDGAALMHLGNLGTIGFESPSNLIHYILDNRTYDTTGGQEIGSTIQFNKIAETSLYRQVFKAVGKNDSFLKIMNKNAGPICVHWKIDTGSEKVGRPDKKPWEVIENFKSYLKFFKTL